MCQKNPETNTTRKIISFSFMFATIIIMKHIKAKNDEQKEEKNVLMNNGQMNERERDVEQYTVGIN